MNKTYFETNANEARHMLTPFISCRTFDFTFLLYFILFCIIFYETISRWRSIRKCTILHSHWRVRLCVHANLMEFPENSNFHIHILSTSISLSTSMWQKKRHKHTHTIHCELVFALRKFFFVLSWWIHWKAAWHICILKTNSTGCQALQIYFQTVLICMSSKNHGKCSQ